MGLLSAGSPLSWEETKKYADHVRQHGIIQFLNIYHKLKDRQKDVLKWGDEVSCDMQLIYPLCFYSYPYSHPTLWRPEYGSYMIEGTPGQPYGGTMAEFNTVEDNMRKRRQEASSLLPNNQSICTVTSFPRLGCPGFTLPEFLPTPVEKGASKSLFFPDEAINKHPRFSTLTRNIRHRRGEKVSINVPIFRDQNTPSPFIEKFPNATGDDAKAAMPDHIYMDAMGFGMGNCCLQMALSAAAPFYRGYVSDIDCRWGVISASVDDRTKEERGLEPLKNNKYRISKSRYDSIDSYLSTCGEKYNDIDLTIDKEVCSQLIKEGNGARNTGIGQRTQRGDIAGSWGQAGIAAVDGCYTTLNGAEAEPEDYTLMSIDTIINGKEGVFPGLLPILNSYLENMEVDVDTRCTILNYLKLIKKRASGELMTVARWMREFVSNHPDYKHDSVITDKINYDLMVRCNKIANGQTSCPDLVGFTTSKTKPSGNETIV
ncbi:hypothetical protein AB205_0025090 [Aquarana catesbeiana]|uniref:Glutamate--cysteine ligase n=1 Tax=Aquarana catesbeiana TaxID=8400 RepID=A0A2G9RHA1_AQUCT|nr:hypothetical protein AB205_0025090 [Aquarana catesbeiana]